VKDPCDPWQNTLCTTVHWINWNISNDLHEYPRSIYIMYRRQLVKRSIDVQIFVQNHSCCVLRNHKSLDKDVSPQSKSSSPYSLQHRHISGAAARQTYSLPDSSTVAYTAYNITPPKPYNLMIQSICRFLRSV